MTVPAARPRKILPNAGGTIAPADVLGRDQTCAEAFRMFDQGSNLLLPDPRRLGKTSLLARLADQAPAHCTVVIIDFQGVGNTQEFLDRLIQALGTHATFRHKLSKLAGGLLQAVRPTGTIEGIELSPIFQKLPPEVTLKKLLDSVDGKLDQGELLILACDEVPMAIENIADLEGPKNAKVLLSTLRELRLRPGSQVRWLITGSVGFHHVVRKIGTTIGMVNDLAQLPLGALRTDDAHHLAACLLIGIDRDGDFAAVAELALITDGIPFLMHQVAHQMRSESGIATAADVLVAFELFIADREQSQSMTHLLTRVDGYYGDTTTIARALLDRVALAMGPLSAADLLPTSGDRETYLTVIDHLLDDHYLVLTPAGFTWRYPVLQRIWIARRMLR